MTTAARLTMVALLAATLVGCGSAAPSPAPTAAPTPVATIEPTAIATAEPSPSALPTSVPGTPTCSTADLKASHGLIEGAAGSVFTEVVLVSAVVCSVDATPSVGLQDGNAGAIVGATPAAGGSIDLGPDGAYSSSVRLANWCGPDPTFPLALVLWIDGEKLVVSGSSFPEDGGLPGCLGDGGVVLEASAWVPSS